MIFVTVGTQLPFDRLIEAIDAWAGRNKTEHIVAQTGYGRYRPAHLEVHPFLSPDECRIMQEQAEIVVAHAGMGTILSALQMAKSLIIFPRVATLNEHRNNHQLGTAKRFEGVRGVYVAYDEVCLHRLLDIRSTLGAAETLSEDASPELIDAVKKFLDRGNATNKI